MIILEEPPESQTKFDTYVGPTLRHPDRAACRSPSLLPDYDASEAQHKRIVKPAPGRFFDSKFWRAALYSLIIYIVLTAVVGIPLIVLKSREDDDSHYSPGSSFLWASAGSFNPPPSLDLANGGNSTIGANSTCNNWKLTEFSSWPPYGSQSQFSLEPTGLITIRSNVSYDVNQETGINGSLSVAYNTDHKATEVIFNVQLRASSTDLRKRVHVCFTDVGNNRGLSIFVPNYLAPADSLLFTVNVLLPQLPPSKRIDSLVTYLPMFSQKFGDLRQFLQFGQISIEGTSFDIECQHLLASYISVKNVLGSITGSFNVTDALTLDTIKGSINTSITLVRLSSATKPTYLTLDTGFSSINTNVTLVGSTSSKALFSLPYPSFVSDVRTFNGPITLDVFHDKSSPSMPFQLHVQNNLAPTNVSLDSKFQGSFGAQTKLASVTVWKGFEDPAADPTGEGKPRTIQYDQNSTTNVSGWIGWGKRPNSKAALSYVEVVSSLSPVTLKLGCKHS